MTVAYKHLEDKLRIAELSFGQWATVGVSLLLAVGWGYVSPLGDLVTLVTALYLVGLPLLAAFMASISDFDLIGTLAAAIRWGRDPGLYLPGPGPVSPGYRLSPDPDAEAADSRELSALGIEELWRS